MEHYDTDHNHVLDENELARARADLGPLVAMLGFALTQGTLPGEYRDKLLATDPELLSLLLLLSPESFPPDFMVTAVKRVLDGGDFEAKMRALDALGQNPQASLELLKHPENLRAIQVYIRGENDGTNRGVQLVARIFESGLAAADPGSPDQQLALGNIIRWVSANTGMRSPIGQPINNVLARALGPYMPYLADCGRQLTGNPPGGAKPPLPVTPEELRTFLGAVFEDAEAREIFNEELGRYIDAHNPLNNVDEDTTFGGSGEFVDRADAIGGLLSLALLAQESAHLSAQERKQFVLDLYTRSVLSSMRFVAKIPGPSMVIGSVAVNLAMEGRKRLEAELQKGVDPKRPTVEANRLIAILTADIDQQLTAAGVTDPRQREAMAKLVTRVYKGEMYDALVLIIQHQK